MPKRLQQPYQPTTPPVKFEDWPRWIDDELNRIRNALLADPVLMSVEGGGIIGIDTTVTTITLGIGDDSIIDIPSGSWNPLTGEWTCSLGGIYTVTAGATLDAFGPGNKTYQAAIEFFVNDISRGQFWTGGPDDVPLALSASKPLLVLGLDVVRFELSTIHDQFTGTTGYSYDISILRNASG